MENRSVPMGGFKCITWWPLIRVVADLTADDVNQVIDSFSWAWGRQSIDVVTLYETFDFVYLDRASGKTHGSPAFEQILDAVRNNLVHVLPKAELQNRITL